ncbi:hypothetical protein BDW74DRAFT_179213 [Aspergillus multicolor]|uniref:uncharacterized protein n=1 Tax=Aspergillus multicolor TaxID=41759 RepID=UPI003CCD00E9
MSNDPATFEQNGLYILVSNINKVRQYHWSLYLATARDKGRIFHMVNSIETNYQWRYRSYMSANVPKSKTLIVAVRITVMDPVLHGPLGDRLEAVSTEPPISRLVWLRRALKDLDDEGFIKLLAKMDEIELDAEMMAEDNLEHQKRSVEKCNYSAV